MQYPMDADTTDLLEQGPTARTCQSKQRLTVQSTATTKAKSVNRTTSSKTCRRTQLAASSATHNAAVHTAKPSLSCMGAATTDQGHALKGRDLGVDSSTSATLFEKKDPMSAYALRKDEDAAVYAVLENTCKTFPDGKQREMTPEESYAMFRWMTNQLAFMELPAFFNETMHSDERGLYTNFMRERFGHRVSSRIPLGIKLPKSRSTKHMGAALIQATGDDTAQRERLVSLIADTHSFKCDPDASYVEFPFVTKELQLNRHRQKLHHPKETLEFVPAYRPRLWPKMDGRGQVLLLYEVHVLDGDSFRSAQMKRFIEAAAGQSVLDVVEVDHTSLDMQYWRVCFPSVKCPTKLLKTRCILATMGDNVHRVYIHYPLRTTFFPCQKCPYWRLCQQGPRRPGHSVSHKSR